MKKVLVLAHHVFKESVRRKNLHALLILSVVVMGCSSLFSFFNIGIQQKFLTDLSLALMSLFGILLAVIIAAGQFPAEMENKTLYPLLARPVSRLEFLLGKWLGTLLVVLVNLTLLGSLFIFIILSKNFPFQRGLLDAMFLLYMQCVFMASLSLAFSLFLSRGANVSLSVVLYFLGHVKAGYLGYLISRSESATEKAVYQVLYYLLPNLENFNVKNLLAFESELPIIYILKTCLYSFGFSAIFLFGAYLLFRRKEL